MPHRWNEVALLRQEQIEDGFDLPFTDVFVPWYMGKVASLKSSRVVEVGAGTGHLANKLHGFAREYVAIEPSVEMYRVASNVLAHTSVRLEQKTVQEAGIGEADLVIAHMCLQVINDLAQVVHAVAGMLKPGGILLAAIPHPCFYNDYKQFFSDIEYSYMREQVKEVSFTISADPSRAISGVPYHHRPLSRYVASLAAEELSTTGLHEIVPEIAVMKEYCSPWTTPRYLVIEAMRSPRHNE